MYLQNSSYSPRLSFDVIELAIGGDPVAVGEVLKAFERDIGLFSVFVNSEGKWEKDKDLEDYIVQNLLAGILKFEFR